MIAGPMTPTSSLASQRRRAARIALYTSLVLVGSVTWGLVKLLDRPLKAHRNEEWATRDYAAMPEVKLLQEYVRIDTSEPYEFRDQKRTTLTLSHGKQVNLSASREEGNGFLRKPRITLRALQRYLNDFFVSTWRWH